MVKLEKEGIFAQEILNVDTISSIASKDPVGWAHVKHLGISDSNAGMTMIAHMDFNVEQSNARPNSKEIMIQNGLSGCLGIVGSKTLDEAQELAKDGLGHMGLVLMPLFSGL